ncbi:efflux RND transporter periplasmic adaptor subunit [Methylophaga pinxianii]|uniref:efflux RND transporter periplasmic adaptor subunit n=2 Tax=Methylophaga TaxID=40222 RepID=UPI001CF3181F|nr:efflux RND transporter periplasmic adaptor subunit [Methylophaga pinxianii]MCB2426109.1 efflux RND transporter periplasmic adaptor subunit [Methylophaga pinxianii]UPH47366.1 efflux RND transporter periplasmic adaptor subunit [Methylophaga pinxianii]
MFNKSHFVFLPMRSLLSVAALILLIMSPAIAEDGHAHEAQQSDQQAQAQPAESNEQHDHETSHDKDNHDELMPKEDEHDHSVESNHAEDGHDHDATHDKESHGDSMPKEDEHDHSAESKPEEEGHAHAEDEGSEHIEMDADMAQEHGVLTAEVTAGQISVTSKLYGRVVLSPDEISQVSARFPGQITRVNVNFGDSVKKGQLLASVESNNSLQSYNVTAPISGVITAKDANTGEVAADQNLFTITNTQSLWAELKVFPGQAMKIKPGQKVRLLHNNTFYESTIKQLLPSKDNAPYRIARVALDNQQQVWFPGLLVEADAITEQTQVNLRIPNSAIQQFEGESVAFVKVGKQYQVRPLQLGINDGQYSEVISGLRQGDDIVVENSYLIKADLEKAGAAHAH